LIVTRALRIGWKLAGLLAAELAGRVEGRQRGSAGPVKLRRCLEQLGPTFVKLGQALSQRRDLLPVSWTVELSRLQGHSRPFPGAAAANVVRTELGAPPSELFASFDLVPLAAASVAQVHRARLHDGREVVVKILRPNVRATIDQDMRILLALTVVGSALVPFLRKHRPLALVRELRSNLRRETDLREEARNIRRFAAAFSGSKAIFIPGVVEELSGVSVLVEELASGRIIGDPWLAQQAKALSEAFVDFYLKQFFVLGLFHADPHPGNVLVMTDGRLCFFDFGAVGMLDERSSRALLAFIQAFIHQDADWLAEAAVDLGLLDPAADHIAMTRGVEAILSDLKGARLEDWSIAGVMLGVAQLSGGDALVLPPHLAALVRTVFTAEGTLRVLNPALDIVRVLRESGETLFAEGELSGGGAGSGPARLKWEAAVALRSAPAAAARALHRVGQGRGFAVHLPEVSEAARRIGRAADRIALALVTLGLYISASLLMQHSLGPRIFGDLPLLGAIGYVLALWFTMRLVTSISRTGGP
jgi:ubiquinone biosynthesis protein